MTFLNDPPFSQLQFYVTAPYGCSYLPNRIARSQIVTPNHLVDQFTYSELIRAGFRRSGVFTYRPHCESCNECLAVRLPVARYEPNRSQRKTLKRHDNLVAIQRPLTFREEHYTLYQRYQTSRHNGGGMDQDSRNQYAQFLLQSQVDSRLIEFREGEKGPLRMVSIIDLLTDGLSSVYTFYDPDIPGASLGTYGIIWQIAQCSHLGLPYLYLGYLIRNSRKMSYKANFRPLEQLQGVEWRPFDPNPDMNATPKERHA